MTQYSWYKSGYLSEHPRKFGNVNKICFNLNKQNCFQNAHNVQKGYLLTVVGVQNLFASHISL